MVPPPCNKANHLLGFLHRILYHCPSYFKERAYKQIVLPSIELLYYIAMWDPYQQTSIHKIEMIQHCTARFVLKKPCVGSMTTYYLLALPGSDVAQQLVEEYCTLYI